MHCGQAVGTKTTNPREMTPISPPRQRPRLATLVQRGRSSGRMVRRKSDFPASGQQCVRSVPADWLACSLRCRASGNNSARVTYAKVNRMAAVRQQERHRSGAEQSAAQISYSRKVGGLDPAAAGGPEGCNYVALRVCSSNVFRVLAISSASSFSPGKASLYWLERTLFCKFPRA